MRPKFDPVALGAKCQECPFAKEGKPNKPVRGEGPVDALGVLVGEGPGAEEEATGRPFIGKTGQELDRELMQAGLVRGRLYVVNATACRPPPGKAEKQLPKATECCRPVFAAQVGPHSKARKPALLMGRAAWQAWEPPGFKIPKGGVEDGRGFVRQRVDGAPYIATWHPTYAFFRNPYETGAFRIDLQRFKRMLTGTLRPRPSKLVVRATWRDVRELIKMGLPISADVESAPFKPSMPWTGKNPLMARLRTVGIGNREMGVSIWWAGVDDRLREWIQKAIYNCIWQNGFWFDHRIMRRYGFRVGPNPEDMRDGRREVSAISRLSLGYIATIYDDPPPWKQNDSDDDKGLVLAQKDPDELMLYNAIDAVEQARCWEGITAEEEWQTPRVQNLYNMHKELAQIAASMHTAGVGVNWWNRGVLTIGLKEEYERREKIFLDAVGIPGMRCNKNDLRAIIYKSCETATLKKFSLPDPITDDGYTETGEIAVNQGALLMLITDPDCPPELVKLIDLFWQADAVKKALGTFVNSKLVVQAIGPDNRIRPGWNSAGTDTGRFSCSEPNLMNLSEAKE